MPADWKSLQDRWKQHKDKPKNLGLKAQKTGITEALGRVVFAESHYLATDPASVDQLLHALKDVEVRCKTAVDKHKQVYTEACKFLEMVKGVATKRHVQIDNQKKIRKATNR